MTSTLTFNKNTKLKMGVANLLKELEMASDAETLEAIVFTWSAEISAEIRDCLNSNILEDIYCVSTCLRCSGIRLERHDRASSYSMIFQILPKQTVPSTHSLIPFPPTISIDIVDFVRG